MFDKRDLTAAHLIADGKLLRGSTATTRNLPFINVPSIRLQVPTNRLSRGRAGGLTSPNCPQTDICNKRVCARASCVCARVCLRKLWV